MGRFFHYTAVLALLCAALLLVSCGVDVTFDIGDATLVSGETLQKYKEDTPVVPPEISKDGYVFVGWEGNYQNPEEPVTVTPVWKKIHTVTFEIADASCEGETVQSVVDGESAAEPILSREGYVFNGWDKEFSVITEDMTVTALWKKIHTVTFDANGGNVDDEALLTQKVVDGEAATAPTVTMDLYDFTGWDADFSVVTGDITAKAKWERKTFTSKEIFSLINPGTVEVKTYRGNHVMYGLGSGFFIDEDGLLLTNYHVIENARAIEVTLSDDTVYTVKTVVAYDKEKDIAILRADTQGKKVPYLEIGTELPDVGDAVYAIGSSLGLTGTFSSGIVSYVNRTVKEAPDVNFIQTTTPISSGNSGGPLVDEHGYVIGINSASYTEGQNLNLAVEISQYKELEEVNMTPEEVFQKEGTLKWYIGEQIVKESTASKNGQRVADGATVEGKLSSRDEMDVYFVESPKEESSLLVMLRADDADQLYEMYALPIYANAANVNQAAPLPEYFYAGEVNEADGETYYVMAVVVMMGVEDYNFLGMALQADVNVEYELFMMFVTEDVANALS